MILFDVEALYTNMSIDDALAIIKELLKNDKTLPDRTPLSPKNVLDLLEFLLRTTFFIFNGTYYQWTERVAMGGPPSSIIAEIYMQGTETTALTTTSHPPKVWECHVDDVFFIVRKSNQHDFFNISTAFIPRQSLPWKLKGIPSSHSWTHSPEEQHHLRQSLQENYTQTNT